MKDVRIYLDHILECLERLEECRAQGKDRLIHDPHLQASTPRFMQVMAESVRRIPDHMKKRCPEIDWRGISGLRNVLVHDYLGIDCDHIWDILEKDLEPLRRCVENLKS